MKFKSGDLVNWESPHGNGTALCIVKRRVYRAYEEKYSRYEVFVFKLGFEARIATSLNLFSASKGMTR